MEMMVVMDGTYLRLLRVRESADLDCGNIVLPTSLQEETS